MMHNSDDREMTESEMTKSLLNKIHKSQWRLTKESYIKVVHDFPELYETLPDDIKCQELELASKL